MALTQRRVEELIRKCKQNRTAFVDHDFPVSARSLYKELGHRPHGHQISAWKRPSQFAGNDGKEPQLFVGGGSAGDVIQGNLGDCWFLGALSVVATRPKLLQQIVSYGDTEAGLYVCRFYKEGAWHSVVVDDQIPCLQNHTPAYSKCRDSTEIWVPIIEKAYAKLHGCYQNLEGGSIADALVDLTGGASEKILLTDDDTRQKIASGALWNTMLQYDVDGFLMGAARAEEGKAVEADTGNGILANHAYGIIDVKQVGPHRLVRLRNPWGQTEWRGAWSDGSPEWSEQYLSQLNYQFADDGTFWMSFSDFCNQFTKLFVCRLYQDDIGAKWDKHVLAGEWKGLTAGGNLEHPTWRSNPQFIVRSHVNTQIFVVISQADARMHNGANQYQTAAGAYIVKSSMPGLKDLQVGPQDVLAQTPFAYAREVSVPCDIQAGTSYNIIACAYLPEHVGKFTITVYGRDPIQVEQLAELPKRSAQGEWRGDGAGGSPNYPTWVQNPQFCFMPVNPNARATIVLRQTLANKRDTLKHIGFQVVKCSDHKRVLLLHGDSIVAQSDYTDAQAVSAEVQMEADLQYPYMIIPSTFYPNKYGKFTLTVFCDSPFLLEPAPKTGVWSGLREVLEARAGGAEIPNLAVEAEAPPAMMETKLGQMRRDPYARRNNEANKLWTTAAGEVGQRAPRSHELNQMKFKPASFTKTFFGKFEGSGMN